MFDRVLNPLLIYYALRTSYKKVSKLQLHVLTFILQVKGTNSDTEHRKLYKVLLTTSAAKFLAGSF